MFDQLRSTCIRWYKLILFGKLSPPYRLIHTTAQPYTIRCVNYDPCYKGWCSYGIPLLWQIMCFSNKSLGINMQILLLFSYHFSPFFSCYQSDLTLIHLLFNLSETTWINSICTIVVFWFRCRARGISAEQYCFCWENNHWHQNSSKTSELSECKNQVIPGQAAKQHKYSHYDMHVLLLLST